MPYHINPTQTKAWKKLQRLSQNPEVKNIKSHLQSHPEWAQKNTVQFQDFYVDFSKNAWNASVVDTLLEFAEEIKLSKAIQAYFGGESINQTENRAVLHTALRDFGTLTGIDKTTRAEIAAVKAKMYQFVEAILAGEIKTYSGKKFTDVVNIGIGGSDLGPFMVTEALKTYQIGLNVHYVSNIDADHVADIWSNIKPETTLFVIVSKSFGTQETLENARLLRTWFIDKLGQQAVNKHFIAVSSSVNRAVDFGVSEHNIFPMWDWVGGRFSLWSAVGMSIALTMGTAHFEDLLKGAHAMDKHFYETDFSENIPVLLALLNLWYNNFLEAESEAIIPYNQALHRLPAYLQQAIMESNGKSVDRNAQPVNYQTGNIVWGEPGTNAQHAFFQLLHQGTKLIPAQFIGFKKSICANQNHHDQLMANFFAQTEALLMGKTKEQVTEELKKSHTSEVDLAFLTNFKVFEGNRPTTTVLIDQLTPSSLGKLIAMYEHKIFTEGVFWNVFSYDQWGVELGKQLAGNILKDLKSREVSNHDPSTTSLLTAYLKG
ncbi:MAG: glucose-6-phosphate isomerase [Flavobacteriaceae bacterium]|nr:glucose-6-phosphate isomerase [Flavobacteriaceae bacterium]